MRPLTHNSRQTLLLAAFFMFTGVLLGAFGAHGLKKLVSSELIATWNTGVKYQLIHGLSLMGMAILLQTTPLVLKWPRRLMSLGIILFSFNCFIYVLSGMKSFAMIVPLGGVSFLLAWIFLAVEVYQQK
jgi:uncharacterized membrane protein YgdD (TMEM256/DUF423 family)